LGDPDGPWHVTRDGLAAFAAVCARAAAICARLARDVIDLSRTEIAEVSEAAAHHRGASSTMPQKANPIDSETVVGMAAVVTATSGMAYRAMEAGHERSAGEWQVEWHAIPQVAVLTAGCLAVAARIAEGMVVDSERMVANLELEQGRTLAEGYMFQLAPELGREAAHDLVYEAALVSKARRIDLAEALREVADDPARITDMDPSDYLGQAAEEARAAVADWRREPGS
jgi:3-carboxy-cis,cis-muconate cycloisomerase